MGNRRRFDVAILGLGSAGEALAEQLAGAGNLVVGFEPRRVGGECPFVACIPSKSMLHDAISGRTWEESVSRRQKLTHGLDDDQHYQGLVDKGVVVIRERARLTGANEVTGESETVTADRVVIATGATPIIPDVEGLERDRVWTSADALTSETCPESILILGGGAIGSELSEVFARFGSEVTLVEHADRLTDDVEPDVANRLADHLGSLGVDVRLKSDVDRVEHHGEGFIAVVDGEELRVERVLVAAGVTPRLEGIGLESVGFSPDVSIDSDGRVGGSDWLFAAGDVTPQSHWTHGANHQATKLRRLFDSEVFADTQEPFPSCIFTNPPVGRVGVTAQQAADRGMDVVVGKARYSDVARSATDDLDDGSVHVVVDRQSGRIVGASAIGARADDVIMIPTILISTGTPIEKAAQIVFAFPTIGQVMERALSDARDQRIGSAK